MPETVKIHAPASPFRAVALEDITPGREILHIWTEKQQAYAQLLVLAPQPLSTSNGVRYVYFRVSYPKRLLQRVMPLNQMLKPANGVHFRVTDPA